MRSTLPIAATILFALIGMDAQAAQIDDKPMSDDADVSAEDSSALAFRGRGGQGGSAGAKGGQSKGGGQAKAASPGQRNQAGQARSAQGTTTQRASAPQQGAAQRASGPQQGAAQRATQANRPMTATRTAGPSSAASRPLTTGSANKGSAARSSGSPKVLAGNNPGAANQVAHNAGHGNTNHGNAVRSASSQGKAGHASAARHARPGAARGRAVRVGHPRFAPARWSPAWHRTGIRGPHWHPRYWTAGVFVYAPPAPGRRVVVVDNQTGRAAEGVAAEPTRAIDRNGDVSLGVRGGSYMSGYDDGGGYGDMGLGAAVRYRPAEAVGLELSWQHHSQTWSDSSERTSDPISASVELFAFPWSRVSPYVLTGVTWNPRSVSDTYSDGWNLQHVEAADTLFGPHAGLGLELAVGKNVSVNFEGKATGYLNVAEGDATAPGAMAGTMGLNFYF
jgi:hypothetical protein